MILDGKSYAAELEKELIDKIADLKKQLDFVPVFATVLVGDDPASQTYVKMKGRMCEKLGLEFAPYFLDNSATTKQVVELIKGLNENKKVYGILVQHPLPRHVDEMQCFNAIDVSKDVDGVNCHSIGMMACGVNAFESATSKGIISLLDHYNIDLAGKNVVVVGRSNILGKPIALLMLQRNATVTICHSYTKDLASHLKNADVVVAALGKPKFIKAEWLKQNVVLIDAGYNAGNVGDIDLENAQKLASAYTPVPGGVGPMTIISLFVQVAKSIENNAGE